jgi:hypothetical protein
MEVAEYRGSLKIDFAVGPSKADLIVSDEIEWMY